MKEKLRIIQMISNYRWTGAADPAVSLAAELRRMGHEVLFICGGKGSLEEEAEKRDLAMDTSLNLGRTNGPAALVRDFFRLKKIITDFQADVLHLHLSHDHMLGGLAAKFSGREKLVVARTHHKVDKIRQDPLHTFIFNRLTDLNVLLSQNSMRKTSSFLKHQLVVPGGVDLKQFKESITGNKARLKYGLGKNRILLGLVSHMRAHRGHEQALEAFNRISEGFPDARLVFLGESDKDYKKQLERLVMKLELESKVIFMVDKEDDWPQMLGAIDVSMYLALGSEGSARAVLESMALGKPVIAARVGAVPEIVEHNQSGIIVPEGDRTALSDAMTTLLHYEEKRAEMGRQGLQIIKKGFRSEYRAEKITQAYFDVLQKKESSSNLKVIP
ncbi:MAG: glycosyltransferase family 4 protein [bacterium]